MGARVTNPIFSRFDSRRYGSPLVMYNDERWYYCGEWDGEPLADYTGKVSRNGGNGEDGDVRVRPEHLGPGEYTCTVGPLAPIGDVTWINETEDAVDE